MDYRHLGRTGLRVSPLCLGTMNFGPQTSEPDSHAVMDAALEAGINFFDTANVYGWKTGEGVTEKIVGTWFAGKILYVGSSNFPGWGIAQANEQAAKRHSVGLVSEQSYYNLMARTVELEVVPACQAYGLGLIPWSPLNRGVLGGILRKQEKGRTADPNVQAMLDANRPAIEAWEAFCDDRGEDPAAVGLAWLLHQKTITAPIIGPRTAQQLTSSLTALAITLDTAALARLDEIFPGPGGPAPEAYAW